MYLEHERDDDRLSLSQSSNSRWRKELSFGGMWSVLGKERRPSMAA